MITVKNLVKDFGARRAVDDVSFEVNIGEVLGFLGPNGAGKSTTMRMITGFIHPTSGTCTVKGNDVTKEPVAARTHIGYLPENAPAYGDMTVWEFLQFMARMRGYSGDEVTIKADEAMERCFITSVKDQTIETLSKGYRQRTCFAQAILHDPPVLILDEPTDGLDPNQKQVVRNMITEMAQEKVIIFSTHVLEEVDAVCNRAIIISNGKIVADAAPNSLRRQSRLYNAVEITVTATPDNARAAFNSIPDVRDVEVEQASGDQVRCRILPKDQQSIATQVLDKARSQEWIVTHVEAHAGRLDDVFRDLTMTEDVARAARKEA
jgi:ABC-2 type transport system ATP-binding protein